MTTLALVLAGVTVTFLVGYWRGVAVGYHDTLRRARARSTVNVGAQDVVIHMTLVSQAGNVTLETKLTMTEADAICLSWAERSGLRERLREREGQSP